MAKNIFIELDLFLDPPIDDAATMKKHLEKERIPFWRNNQASQPKFEVHIDKAKKYIAAKFPKLKEKGTDARNEQYAELERQAKIIVDTGVTEKRVKNLVNEFQKFFREDTIKKLVSLEGQSDDEFVIPACPDTLKCDKPVSFADMSKISDALDVATDGKDDSLYKLLGATETEKTADILTKAKKKAKEINDIAKKDIKANALNQLAKKFLQYFKNDEERDKYDTAIKRFPFDNYANKTLRLYADAWKNKTNWDKYHERIGEVKNLGYTEEESAWLVYAYFCLTKKCPLPKKTKQGGWRQHEVLRTQLLNLFNESIEVHRSNAKVKNKLQSVIEQFNEIDDPDNVEGTVRQIIEVDLRKFWDSCKSDGSVTIPLFKPALLSNYSRLKDYLQEFTHTESKAKNRKGT
jgi:hypothetical protein